MPDSHLVGGYQIRTVSQAVQALKGRYNWGLAEVIDCLLSLFLWHLTERLNGLLIKVSDFSHKLLSNCHFLSFSALIFSYANVSYRVVSRHPLLYLQGFSSRLQNTFTQLATIALPVILLCCLLNHRPFHLFSTWKWQSVKGRLAPIDEVFHYETIQCSLSGQHRTFTTLPAENCINSVHKI